LKNEAAAMRESFLKERAEKYAARGNIDLVGINNTNLLTVKI